MRDQIFYSTHLDKSLNQPNSFAWIHSDLCLGAEEEQILEVPLLVEVVVPFPGEEVNHRLVVEEFPFLEEEVNHFLVEVAFPFLVEGAIQTLEEVVIPFLVEEVIPYLVEEVNHHLVGVAFPFLVEVAFHCLLMLHLVEEVVDLTQ
jgi:hypothetical protein